MENEDTEIVPIKFILSYIHSRLYFKFEIWTQKSLLGVHFLFCNMRIILASPLQDFSEGQVG